MQTPIAEQFADIRAALDRLKAERAPPPAPEDKGVQPDLTAENLAALRAAYIASGGV